MPPPPRKSSNLKILKHHFQGPIAVSKRFRKLIVIFFLTLTKERCHHDISCKVFSNLRIIATPLCSQNTILVSYEGTKVYSVVLSSVHLRSASLQSARWEKDWSLLSNSVKM